jgi:sec-independent protein translocase protein TatA
MFSSALLFLDIGGPELMLILFVALLLFGGDKLPGLAKGLGKGIRDFKDASEGVKREIANQIDSYETKKPETVATTEALPAHEDETITNPDHLVEGHVANTIPAGESHVATDSPELTTDHYINEKRVENHADAAHVSTGTDQTNEHYKS